MRIVKVKGSGKCATYSISYPSRTPRLYAKLRPAKDFNELKDEATRSRWLQGKLPVSTIAWPLKGPSISLLLTSAIAGEPSHKFIHKINPAELMQTLYETVKIIQAVNPSAYPFSSPEWTSRRIALRRIDMLDELKRRGKRLHPDFASLSRSTLRKIISSYGENSKSNALVHGDLCLPNILLAQSGAFCGILDVGSLHVGSPLFDIAILSWSIEANLGTYWSEYFLNLCNVDIDCPSIRYYRLVYDLALNRGDAWAWIRTQRAIQSHHSHTDLLITHP